jgi:hypothetical protein
MRKTVIVSLYVKRVKTGKLMGGRSEVASFSSAHRSRLCGWQKKFSPVIDGNDYQCILISAIIAHEQPIDVIINFTVDVRPFVEAFFLREMENFYAQQF